MTSVYFPDEIWENILIHSSVQTLSTMACVNKHFNVFIESKLWDYIDLLPKPKLHPIPKNLPTFNKFFWLIDWTSIVCNDQTIPEEVLAELIDVADLVAISCKQKLSIPFIKAHLDRLPAHNIIHNQNVTSDILQVIVESNGRIINTYALWERHFIDIHFIKQHINFVNWMALSSNKNALSIEVIEEFPDKLFWPELTKHGLCEWIIEKYIHKIDKFSWSNVAFFCKLSKEFITKHINNLNLLTILHTQDLDEAFIEQLVEHGSEEYETFDLWNKTATNQGLSLEFLGKHKNNLPIKLLIRNRKIKRKHLKDVFTC